MSFMLGSFGSGLFGGATSVMRIAGMVQDFQNQQAQTEAADKVKDAQQSDQNWSGVENTVQNLRDQNGPSIGAGADQATSSADASPAIGPVADPGKIKVPDGTKTAEGPALDPALRSRLESQVGGTGGGALTSAGMDPDAQGSPAISADTPLSRTAAAARTAAAMDPDASRGPGISPMTPGQMYGGAPPSGLTPQQTYGGSPAGQTTANAPMTPGQMYGGTAATQPALPKTQAAAKGQAEAPDMSKQFNTVLSPQDEAKFQAWAAANGKANDTYDYDLRGAWKSGAATSPNGHLPDTFKKPNHPTFSDQSQYSTPQTPGGSWVDQGNGKWAFSASPTNVQMQGATGLQDYFKRVEPGNTLQLPPGDAQLSQDARAARYAPAAAPTPSPKVDPNQPQLAQLRAMQPAQLAVIAQNPQQYGMDPSLVRQAQQERSAPPPAPPTQPQVAPPQTPGVQTDPNTPQLAQMRTMSPEQFAGVAADPARYGMDPSLVAQAQRERSAAQAIPSAGGSPAPAGGAAAPSAASPSLGSRILSMVNPISSAQAAPSGLPQAQQDTPAAAPVSPTVGATPPAPAAPAPQGALAQGAANAAKPAEVAAQQQTQTPDPAAGPTAVSVPATTTQVAPGQQGPTTQSEATPKLIKPMINQAYYGALAEQAPAWRARVDQIATEEHITPDRLAGHWYLESGFHTSAGRGKAGEEGIMQMLPATRDLVDPQHQLDPNKPEDSLRLGARYINLMDREFGQNSVGSWAAYQGGPGTADAIARDPAGAVRYHPNTMAYVKRMAADGTELGPQNFAVGNPPDARAMVQAASQGPNSFVSYIAQTGSPGMQMTDKWRQAETALVYAAARRGDYAGVAHARDMVLQMSQAGVMDNTMQAYKLLQAGDGVGAAQYLAKAHVFFPDSTMGQFGVDAAGNVWAQRVDEHDPSRKLGAPTQVTPQALSTMMIQTRDPNTFVKLVNEQQKLASELRLQAAQTANVLDEPGSRARASDVAAYGHQLTAETAALGRESVERVAGERNQTLRDVGRARDETALDVAGIRSSKGASGAGAAKSLDTEVGKAWGPDATRDDGKAFTAQQRALGSQIHHDIRANAAEAGGAPQTGPHAEYLARGLVSGSLNIVQGKDGRFGVIDPKAPGQVLGVMSPEMGRFLQASQYTPPTAGALQVSPPTSQMVH